MCLPNNTKILEQIELMGSMLYNIYDKIDEKFLELGKKCGLTKTNLYVLSYIVEESGITLSDIARKSNYSKSQIFRSIELFQERGWVKKRSDPDDSRVIRLHSTRIVKKKIEEFRERFMVWLQSAFSNIPEDRLEQMLNNFFAIVVALEQEKERESKMA